MFSIIVIEKDDSMAYVNEMAEELKQYATAKGIDNVRVGQNQPPAVA